MQKKTVPKSVRNFLFFVVLGLAFFVMWGRQFQFDSKIKNKADENAVQKTGPICSLEPFVVELAGRYLKVNKVEEGRPPYVGTRKRYLSAAIDLELRDEKALEVFETRRDEIRVVVSQIACSKNVKDVEIAKGKTALGNEIATKINSILGEDIVTKVFFAEFIIH